MLKVIECREADADRMLVKFEGGFTRLFFKKNFMKAVKMEQFYENNKDILRLGYACATGKLRFM